MKTLLLASVLLVWSMMVYSQDPTPPIKVKKEKDGIILECPMTDMKLYNGSDEMLNGKLLYEDSNTGEYMCKKEHGNEISYMYVKFRTCKNCIQVDPTAATSMAIGNLVATVMIGVAVYHIASQSRGTPAPIQQASDRRALIPNESNNESHYQKLNNRTRSNDLYSYARTG